MRDVVAAYNESIRELSREVDRAGQPQLLREGLTKFVATAAVPAVFAGLQPAGDGTFIVALLERNSEQFAEHERVAIVGQALCECFAFVATHVQDALPSPIREQAAARLGELAELVSRTAPISTAPQPVAAPPPAAPLFQPATTPLRRSVPTRKPAPLWLKVLTFALFFALVGAIALVARKREPVDDATPTAETKKKPRVVSPKPSHATETEPPPVSAKAPAAPAATMGMIVTAPEQVGHRLFVDGKLIGDSPQRVEVTCGEHTVQFGGKGPVQKLDVKCGEELVVRLK